MRQLIYLCDFCTKELGNKRHLSFHFAGWSGYAEPDDFGDWYHIANAVRSNSIKHFCSMTCFRKYLLRAI